MRRLAIALVAIPAILQGRPAAAQQPNVDFSVSGTSTIRGWTCTVKGVVAVTPSTGSSKPAPGFPNGVQTATVTVQVKNFQCPEDEMRQHLMDAMKPDKFPEIVYKMEKYDMTGAQAQASGSITIGGVTAPIAFPIALKAAPDGVQIEGATPLDMTKFGIEPPVVMLGMLKVRPQIRINFKGVLPAR
jgi:polyisoprenoid-binding protein YceI